MSIYVTWMYLVFMYVIPFATLAIFNLLTWQEMRKALARRAQLSTQEQKEHNLATMFLVVVMVFFICNLLPLVVNILELVGISNQQLIQVCVIDVYVRPFDQHFRVILLVNSAR
jgi:uncharacterized membrane protein